MNLNCNIPYEDLPFELFGLCLQEPMSMVTNGLISIATFIFYVQLKPRTNTFYTYWKYFFILLSISTFLGGLSHVFFYYTGILGKMPSWLFAFMASIFAGKGMIVGGNLSSGTKQILSWILYSKSLILFLLAVIYQSFIFVTVDSAITYLFFCFVLGIIYWKKGIESFKYIVFGVVVLISSIFIFLLNINPHLWFNKNDLSHVIITLTICFFYLGILKFKKKGLVD